MFEWKSEMAVDNGQVDADHKELFRLANCVLEIDQPRQDIEILKQLIYDLYDYVKFHFSREEDLMRKIGYPELEDHKQKHQFIIADMNHYLKRSHHLGEVLSGFRQLVNRWVVTHIMEEDKKIQTFMNKSDNE